MKRKYKASTEPSAPTMCGGRVAGLVGAIALIALTNSSSAHVFTHPCVQSGSAVGEELFGAAEAHFHAEIANFVVLQRVEALSSLNEYDEIVIRIRFDWMYDGSSNGHSGFVLSESTFESVTFDPTGVGLGTYEGKHYLFVAGVDDLGRTLIERWSIKTPTVRYVTASGGAQHPAALHNHGVGARVRVFTDLTGLRAPIQAIVPGLDPALIRRFYTVSYWADASLPAGGEYRLDLYEAGTFATVFSLGQHDLGFDYRRRSDAVDALGIRVGTRFTKTRVEPSMYHLANGGISGIASLPGVVELIDTNADGVLDTVSTP